MPRPAASYRANRRNIMHNNRVIACWKDRGDGTLGGLRPDMALFNYFFKPKKAFKRGTKK